MYYHCVETRRFFCTSVLWQLFLIYIPTPTKSSCDAKFGDLWQPSWSVETRNDLRCSKVCPNEPLPGFTIESESYESCCTCHTCINWEGKETDLFIEFVSVLGKSLVLADQAPYYTDVYKIEHTDSEMTEFPCNLCIPDKETNLANRHPDEFHSIQQILGNIVKINFENNKIRKLSDLNCLVRLDELNIRNNNLTYITNNSINELVHLRSVDFSSNFIQNMDPTVLTSPILNLFFANFSFNRMTQLDITNMMSLHPFCEIDYKANHITEMVNELEFQLDFNKTYGPGFTDLTDTSFDTWPDFKELLHLDDLSQLGHLINFGFDFREIPLVCDCNFEPFMTLAKDIVETIWRDYMNVSCTAPENLAGIPVFKVDPAQFICQLSADSNCQTPECTCVDKPNEETLFIDCSNSGLQQWPKIPQSKFSKSVSLNISGNLINSIEQMPYTANLSMLDISRNQLLEITNNDAKILENVSYLDISNNPNLGHLPQLFQYRNICSTYMKNLEILCDCNSSWIQSWLRSRQCEMYDNVFNCDIPSIGIHFALDFDIADLECFSSSSLYLFEILAGSVTFILILVGISIYVFRYELIIIYIRIRQKIQNNEMQLFDHDVILSYNDENDYVRGWVNRNLESYLIRAGYHVFHPSRDVTYGADRDPEVIHAFMKTCNLLVILSDDYLAGKIMINEKEEAETMRSWTWNEWKYGWNNYKTNKFKNIVNFDHVSSFDINHPQIKAFLRVGGAIDFTNPERNITEKICAKLGQPCHQPKQTNKQNKMEDIQKHKIAGTIVNNEHNMNYIQDNVNGKSDRDTAEIQVNCNYDFKQSHNSAEIEIHDIPEIFMDNLENDSETDACSHRKRTLKTISDSQLKTSSEVKVFKPSRIKKTLHKRHIYKVSNQKYTTKSCTEPEKNSVQENYKDLFQVRNVTDKDLDYTACSHDHLYLNHNHIPEKQAKGSKAKLKKISRKTYPLNNEKSKAETDNNNVICNRYLLRPANQTVQETEIYDIPEVDTERFVRTYANNIKEDQTIQHAFNRPDSKRFQEVETLKPKQRSSTDRRKSNKTNCMKQATKYTYNTNEKTSAPEIEIHTIPEFSDDGNTVNSIQLYGIHDTEYSASSSQLSDRSDVTVTTYL